MDDQTKLKTCVGSHDIILCVLLCTKLVNRFNYCYLILSFTLIIKVCTCSVIVLHFLHTIMGRIREVTDCDASDRIEFETDQILKT